jgi:glycosyltransferase involved in cell wall biosynthesis
MLVATYHFAPDASVGARRWDAMSAWLRELGHEVTVLTTRAWGACDDDGGQVIRTGDMVASQTLRRLLKRPPLPSPGGDMPVQTAPPRLLADVVVPDAYLISWVTEAVPAARRLLAGMNFDCLVTSSPPNSTHLLGLMLGSRRPAWIADFRDGWRYEMLRPAWPTRSQERLDAALERRVARTTDTVVGVTRPIAADFADRLGARSAHIPNGWDPRVEPRLDAASRPALNHDSVNLVHTGQLSGLRGRDPRPLFDALGELRREHPEAASRLQVVLAGRLDTTEQKLLADLEPSLPVVHVGYLDRAGAAALQREADALLLLTSVGHASQATGKLFEYIASGRPIIALAQNNEAARIITETRTGITVAPDQPHEIAQALLAAVNGALADVYAPRGFERYVYPAPAVEFAAEVERVIAEHAIAGA